MGDPRTQLVADAYDAIGETFAERRREREDDLAARLPDGARVLELGCGGGAPETRRLAQRFALVGVGWPPPQAEPTSSKSRRPPRPTCAGAAVRTRAGAAGSPSSERKAKPKAERAKREARDWLGAETFFSSFPPEGPARFQWVLARR